MHISDNYVVRWKARRTYFPARVATECIRMRCFFLSLRLAVPRAGLITWRRKKKCNHKKLHLLPLARTHSYRPILSTSNAHFFRGKQRKPTTTSTTGRLCFFRLFVCMLSVCIAFELPRRHALHSTNVCCPFIYMYLTLRTSRRCIGCMYSIILYM